MRQKASLAVVAAASALLLSNCSQFQSVPRDFSADFVPTGGLLPIATSDCKVVCTRAEGTSQGVNLFGFIPLKSVSECVATKNMYNGARNRSA